MNDGFPLVTVITMVRNNAETIEKTIKSVLNQTYPYIEYIVLDGDSDDGTTEIIRKYSDQFTYWHSKKDDCSYDAMNQGAQMAQGVLIGYLSGDDWLEKDAIQKIAGQYTETPDAGIVSFGLTEWQLESGKLVARRKFVDPDNGVFDIENGLYGHGINRFYTKDIFEKYGYFFYKKYPILADRDLHLRLGLNNTKKVVIKENLYNFLKHKKSITTGGNYNSIIEALGECLRMAEDHLADRNISAGQRRILKRWYCFNVIRLVYFLCKTGKMFRAIEIGLRAFLKYPLIFIRTVFKPYINQELRPENQ